MSAMMESLEAKLQQQRIVKAQFEARCAGVTLETFADVEAFPLTNDMQIKWHSQHQLDELKSRIGRFFEYDTEYCEGRAQKMWPVYLAAAFPWMQQWSLDVMLMALVVRCWLHRLRGVSRLQYIEFFCGVGNLSKAAIEAGLQGVSLDIQHNPGHNVLLPEGLLLWIAALTSTAAGALSWIGCPCNSFVILCRAQSMRMAENLWLGDQSKFFVLEGNTLADISGMLLWLSWMLCLSPALEQPENSCLPHTAAMEAVMRYIAAHRVVTYHFAFGGPTLKPLQLWSSSDFINELERDRPMVYNQDGGLVTRDADGSFTGDKERLKESQAYSKMFGRAIISAFLRTIAS